MKEWMNDLSKGSQYLEQEITTKKKDQMWHAVIEVLPCADLTTSYCTTDYSSHLCH